MNIGLQLSPKLFGAEFAGVLISNDEQTPDDQSGQDLAQEADRVMRGEMLQLQGLAQPAENDLDGLTVAIQQADLVSRQVDQTRDERDLLTVGLMNTQHAETMFPMISEMNQGILQDFVAAGKLI